MGGKADEIVFSFTKTNQLFVDFSVCAEDCREELVGLVGAPQNFRRVSVEL